MRHIGYRQLHSATRRVIRHLAIVLFALVPGLATSAPTLYGITFPVGESPEVLFTVDTASGAGTLVGSLTSNMSAFGLGATGGRLYTFDQVTDRLQELDPATGATVASIDLGLALFGEGGVAFRPDGVGFLNATSGNSATLYRFTTAPGSGVLVGTNQTAGIDGLAFSPGNVLYALGQDPQNNLYTVDQSNGALTLIGPTGIEGDNSVGGLEFIGTTLYAAINNSLYSLDTGTGAATLIGGIGFRQVSGLALLDLGSQVPEPGPIALLALGLALLGLTMRRGA